MCPNTLTNFWSVVRYVCMVVIFSFIGLHDSVQYRKILHTCFTLSYMEKINI